MAKKKNEYIQTLIYIFIAFGAFIFAILSAYFGGVGLYFGQAVVEGDVFTGAYKYECINQSQTASGCTAVNTSVETDAFTAYKLTRTDINDTIPLYLNSTFIVFSLLGLVFLFLALRSTGLMKKSSSDKRDEF
jgi:hypothetical protein